jgi:hypothetical protein
MTTHPTLRDTIEEAVRSHALYRMSGVNELWRCTCKDWEAQGLDGDPWQAHLTDALLAAVQPHIDAWTDNYAKAEVSATRDRARAERAEAELAAAKAERDALRGQLADAQDALERANTEARIATAQRDRWRDAAREARAALAAAEAREQAVREIAFDPDTISALERGAIGTPPNVDGLSKDEALGYAVDALRGIRRALSAVPGTAADPAHEQREGSDGSH